MHDKRAISPDTALRLARYFGMTETFWPNLQVHHDLEIERDRLGSRLEKEVVLYTRSGQASAVGQLFARRILPPLSVGPMVDLVGL